MKIWYSCTLVGCPGCKNVARNLNTVEQYHATIIIRLKCYRSRTKGLGVLADHSLQFYHAGKY